MQNIEKVRAQLQKVQMLDMTKHHSNKVRNSAPKKYIRNNIFKQH